MKLPYRLLDVFTNTPLAGNPLAVVLEGDGLSAGRMQEIAREFNLSETVFVLTPRDPVNTARLRIFTPAVELPFAGHPTIGAAILIASERARDMLGTAPLRLVLEEEIGPVVCEVARIRNGLRSEFVAPVLPQIAPTSLDVKAIAAALGLGVEEIGFSGHHPCIAEAGVQFAFIPVAGRAALDRVQPDFSALASAINMPRLAICLYTEETANPDSHLQARVFAPGLGAAEDPATGSAAAAFAAVALRFERPEDGEHVIAIEQGFAAGRPSLIALTLNVENGALTEVRVGGGGVIVAAGVLSL